jgi:hypothetical protein
MLIAIIALSCIMPVMTIAAFVIGYNINAPKKILKPPKKQKKSKEQAELEEMMERIENATVYGTEE